jgi:hypothetical protein
MIPKKLMTLVGQRQGRDWREGRRNEGNFYCIVFIHVNLLLLKKLNKIRQKYLTGIAILTG